MKTETKTAEAAAKTAETKPIYKVMVLASGWNPDGSAIIEHECEHNHRTLSGALTCLCDKTKRHADGMYAAKWYHAKIYHEDGSKLTDAEKDEAFELGYFG